MSSRRTAWKGAAGSKVRRSVRKDCSRPKDQICFCGSAASSAAATASRPARRPTTTYTDMTFHQAVTCLLLPRLRAAVQPSADVSLVHFQRHRYGVAPCLPPHHRLRTL